MERWMVISGIVFGALLALDVWLFIRARRQEIHRRMINRLEQVIGFSREGDYK